MLLVFILLLTALILPVVRPARGEAAPDLSLSNPDANERTKRLYETILRLYGKKMLSSQMESNWRGVSGSEMEYVKAATGKLPAMRGLDFIDNDFDSVVRRATDWDKRGGVVTICWHTGVGISGYKESQEESPDFDRLFLEGTPENVTLTQSWARAARALKELQDRNIPVLWRPFHEFDGQWFWWGKGGPDCFIRLWRLMYRTFTETFGLNNLIWVLGYSGEVKDGWYPGDEYVDIAGSDTYDGSTNLRGWERLQRITHKPLAFHECGKLPDDIRAFERDGAMWAWFMPWHTRYLRENEPERLKAAYDSGLVVTLEDMPKF